jgi:hypothetical protein
MAAIRSRHQVNNSQFFQPDFIMVYYFACLKLWFFYISSKQLPIRNHHLGFFNLLLPINILFFLHLSQNGDFIVITSKFIFKNNYYHTTMEVANVTAKWKWNPYKKSKILNMNLYNKNYNLSTVTNINSRVTYAEQRNG